MILLLLFPASAWSAVRKSPSTHATARFNELVEARRMDGERVVDFALNGSGVVHDAVLANPQMQESLAGVLEAHARVSGDRKRIEAVRTLFPGFAAMAADEGMRGRATDLAAARAAAVERIATLQAAADAKARFKELKRAGFDAHVYERILREQLGMDDDTIAGLLKDSR